ncbi:helix-turn-helix domain-containing protein, partial [Xanthocytophaga agilis]
VLPENQKFTIFALALESGFNSKTSFNRNFKKYMHCSPREFLK